MQSNNRNNHRPFKKLNPIAIAAIFGFGVLTEAGHAQITQQTLSLANYSISPIIIERNASDEVRHLAKELQRVLSKKLSLMYPIEEGSAGSGIHLRLIKNSNDGNESLRDLSIHRESFRIEIGPQGAVLESVTERGLGHAIWTFADKIGYRQFFPGGDWEVFPDPKEIALPYEVKVYYPDFWARDIWYSYGSWPAREKELKEWKIRNRVSNGVNAEFSHSYQRIISQYREEFAQTPGSLCPPSRNPGEQKLNLDSKDAIRIAADYVTQRFSANPQLDSVSIEPSDGDGWCRTITGEQHRSTTDRLVDFADDVVRIVNREGGGRKYVSFYAYNKHAEPPSKSSSGGLLVAVATAFGPKGTDSIDLLRSWGKMVEAVGVREYLSVNAWDRDRPSVGRAADINYLRRSVPEFYSAGSRFYTAESGDNWGPHGFGYYLVSKMLWDITSASQVGFIFEDFCRKAFESSCGIVRGFYERFLFDAKKFNSIDELRAQYSRLALAKEKAANVEVIRRIDGLILYVEYLRRLTKYTSARGEGRQVAFEELIEYSHSIRCTGMIHSVALYRDLVKRDSKVRIPKRLEWDMQSPMNDCGLGSDHVTALVTRIDSILRH